MTRLCTVIMMDCISNQALTCREEVTIADTSFAARTPQVSDLLTRDHNPRPGFSAYP